MGKFLQVNLSKQCTEGFFNLAEALNREEIAVSGLADGTYALLFDGKDVAHFTSAELKRGVLSEDALFDLLEENRLAASDVLYAFAQLMSQGAF